MKYILMTIIAALTVILTSCDNDDNNNKVVYNVKYAVFYNNQEIDTVNVYVTSSKPPFVHSNRGTNSILLIDKSEQAGWKSIFSTSAPIKLISCKPIKPIKQNYEIHSNDLNLSIHANWMWP